MTDYDVNIETVNYDVNIASNAVSVDYEKTALFVREYTAGDGLDLSDYEFSIEAARLAKIDVITIDGDGNIYLADDGNYKSISIGEANTASNLGAGSGIFTTKDGVNLPFKSLTAGSGITLASDTNTITISSSVNGLIDGGTAGQVLAKIDATDYNVQWADQASGNPFDQDLNTTDEVEFFSITARYIEVIIPTITASSEANGENAASKVIDRDLTSKWTSSPSSSGWLKVDYGSSKTIKAYKITGPISGQSTFAPKDWTFEGSNDDSDWDILDTVTSETSWSAIENRTFAFDNSTAYRYYRLNISDNNGGIYFSLVELYLYVIGDGGYTLDADGLIFDEQDTPVGNGLVLGVKNDQIGSANLFIQNRTGLNGAKFSTKGSNVNVVDFNFETDLDSATIRYESRSTKEKLDIPEFQFGETDDPAFVVSMDDIALAKSGGKFYLTTDKDASIYYSGGNIFIESNGNQILTEQQPAIADLAGGASLADTITKVNDILAMLRTHGLIAT